MCPVKLNLIICHSSFPNSYRRAGLGHLIVSYLLLSEQDVARQGNSYLPKYIISKAKKNFRQLTKVHLGQQAKKAEDKIRKMKQWKTENGAYMKPGVQSVLKCSHQSSQAPPSVVGLNIVYYFARPVSLVYLLGHLLAYTVFVCVQISLSYKDVSHIGLEVTQ